MLGVGFLGCAAAQLSWALGIHTHATAIQGGITFELEVAVKVSTPGSIMFRQRGRLERSQR
jgi:hypothetical protein